MEVIDAHTHIYPTKIADRAVSSVQRFYSINSPELFAGTSEDVLSFTKSSPIKRFIVYSVAVKPSNVTSINDFIAEESKQHPEFIGFGTMHQDFENPEAEIERALSIGLHGFKLHPDTQQVNMDDPRLMPVYKLLEKRNVPVVIHCGDYRYDYSNPERLAHILNECPDLIVDATHFGNWSKFDIGWDVLHEYPNVYVDTSSSSFFLGARHMQELIRLWGTERVMFGSDYPMWNPQKEYEILSELDWTEEERKAIFHDNALRFAGLN